MSYFDDYDYPDCSILDELVNDTTDKIKNMIINEAKEKVDIILNKAKETENRLNIAYNRLKELNNNIVSLETRNKELEEEVNRKRTSQKELPFEIGQEVYVYSANDDYTIECPHCLGKGKVNVDTEKFGYIEVTCPVCHTNTYYDKDNPKPQMRVRYWSYRPITATVSRITIDYMGNDIKTVVWVRSENSNAERGFQIGEVFSNYKDCRKFCEDASKKERENAERKIKGEKLEY